MILTNIKTLSRIKNNHLFKFQNADPDPPKKVKELQLEINQLNIERAQAFKDQQKEIEEIKRQLKQNEELKDQLKQSEDIKDQLKQSEELKEKLNDQLKETEELKEKLNDQLKQTEELQEKLKDQEKIVLQNTRDVIGLLLDQMVKKVEDDMGDRKKRQLLIEPNCEQGQTKKRPRLN